MPNPAVNGHACVFIYADRTVGVRTLPGPPQPSWKIPRQRPLKVLSFKNVLATFDQFPEFEVDEYWNRGRMFDGRSIYCAEGILLEEAVCRGFSTRSVQDQLDELNRRNTRRLCEDTWPSYIELDEKYGDGKQFEIDLKAQCLVYREARLLIAI